MRTKKLGVNGIHCSEIIHILQKHRGFQHIAKHCTSRIQQYFLQVFKHLGGLFGNAARDNVVGNGC